MVAEGLVVVEEEEVFLDMWHHELDSVILICPFQLGIFHDSMRWSRIHIIIIVGRNFKDHWSSGSGGGGGGGFRQIIFRHVVP